MTDIAQRKLEYGDVSVITGPIGYQNTYASQNQSLDERIKIHRVTIPSLDKNKLISRILRLVILSFKISFSIFTKIKKRDNVLLVTNPAFLIILVALIKKSRNFNLTILVHDVFPENLAPAGISTTDSIIYKLLSRIYNFSYSRADQLIVLGDDMKELMQDKLSGRRKIPSIQVIPNWANPDLTPLDINKSAYYSLNLENKIVIGFCGNLGRLQGISEFVSLFTRADNPHLSLVLVGDGALKNVLLQEIKQKNLTNIHFVGSRSRKEEISFLNACDIGLITLKEGMRGLGVPSKTYNLMAVGKPLLYVGDKESEVDRYVNSFGCGWSYDWSQSNDVVAFLKSITPENIEDIKKKGAYSLKALEENFTKVNLLNRF
jgi:glycosyltransferase involved in cell wall biosynthesis